LFVKARDAAGLEDPTPASRAFTVNVVASGLTFTAIPDTLAGGGTVTVTWNGVTSPSRTDWIGVYRAGAADTAYLAYQYVNCGQSPGLTPRPAGSCPFRLSGVGSYEFRYFRNNGFTKLATSNAVTVGASGTVATVSIQATVANAAEGGTQGQFTITRTGSTTGAMTVNYTVGGTASNGTDYTTLTGNVTLGVGAASAVLPVLPADDPDAEGNETVIVTLGAGSGYALGTPSTATVTIVDNEAASGPLLTVSPSTSALGGYVTVVWQGIPNARGTDWIGLYRQGAGNGAYTAFQYVNCTASPSPTPRATGSCSFQLRQRGTFEFRYFPNNGLTPLLTSPLVTVP